MFSETKSFNQNISSWNLDKVEKCDFILDKAKAFLDKYNGGESLPYNTKKIKDWFNFNRDKIKEKYIKEEHGDEIDGFFSNITNLTQKINKDI